MSPDIHDSAIISKDAIIEDDVFVGPYAYVGEGVHLKKGVRIMHHANIYRDTEIGEGTVVYPFATLGSQAQDMKFGGERTKLRIGANTTIREYCDFNTATGEGNETVIGDNCFIMAYVHVAHNCNIGSGVIIANAVQFAGHVQIHDNAIIGGMAGFHQFTRVGSYAMIGAGAILRKDVVPYAMVTSQPTKIKSFNVIGLQRNGYTPEQVNSVKELFKILYHSKLNTSNAIKKIKEELDISQPEIKYFIEFIESSERGIII